MQILKKSEDFAKGKSGRDVGDMGIFEKFVLQEEVLDALLALVPIATAAETDNTKAIISTVELGSKGETSNGACYGLNKVFVAGHLPLQAKPRGKANVVVINTGNYNEDLYATDKSIVARGSQTAYEEPSTAIKIRTVGWLKQHGYIEEPEADTESEK